MLSISNKHVLEKNAQSCKFEVALFCMEIIWFKKEVTTMNNACRQDKPPPPCEISSMIVLLNHCFL